MLILWIVHSLSGFSQDSCVVKVYPNDCVNCYLGMTSIKSAPQKLHKTIVFPNLSEAQVKAYLKDVFNITDITNYTIIVSDSVYKSLDDNISSEVYLYNKNQLYSHSLLKNYYGFDKPVDYEIMIPDTIAISDAATIVNNKDYFFITDPQFAKCVFISKHNKHTSTVVKARSLTTKENFNKLFGDTLGYYMFSKYRDVLAEANMDKIKFGVTFGKQTMAAFVLAPDIEEDETGNAKLKYINGIVIFNTPAEYTLLRIEESSLPDNYVIYPRFFSKHGNNYYIQVVGTNRDNDDQYLLGQFYLSNQKLVFSNFVDYKIPSEYLPAKKFTGLSKIVVSAYPFLLLQYSLSVFNFENNRTMSLPLDSIHLVFDFPNQLLSRLKLESDVKIVDAFVSNNVIQVLYKKSDIYFVAYIDGTHFNLIKTKKITKSFNDLKIGPAFYSKDRLLYLTKGNTIIVRSVNN